METALIPSSELFAARRALEGLQGFKLTQDWYWQAEIRKWVLRCQLAPTIENNDYIPEVTCWYVLVDNAYPWGSIKFYPAKDQGIKFTFPHQNYNEESETFAWREGDLCLNTDVHSLGRRAYHPEPYKAEKRLLWHCNRALIWLTLASQGKLADPGDPYELPQFPLYSDHSLIAFEEDTDSFEVWHSCSIRVGLVEFAELNHTVWYTKRYLSLNEIPIFTPIWGKKLSSISPVVTQGIWLLLDNTPILPVWQAPATWGELRVVCENQGISIDNELEKASIKLRDGKPHFLLLGFPIPENIGEAERQIHWQALILPVLSAGRSVAKGFRPNQKGYWRRDRAKVLADSVPLMWMRSENWHRDQITTRGILPLNITSKRILIIGIGAIGSVISELLVRAGIGNLLIVDQDKLEVGNLVRHTLEMDNVGAYKSQKMADKLNSLSPHTSVSAINHSFPPVNQFDLAKIRDYDLIIDCTGDDKVLRELNTFAWTARSRTFISISIGLMARRLYCFTSSGNRFPESEFRDLITPWLKKDLEENSEEELPREGIGCWHPVFPARADDIWLLASVAVKHIVAISVTNDLQPALTIFEQCYENGLFTGVQKLNGDAV